MVEWMRLFFLKCQEILRILGKPVRGNYESGNPKRGELM